MSLFLDALRQQPLLSDGAIGSYLFERTGRLSEQNHLYENFNLERPDLIRQLHFEYLQADAQGQPVREEAHACRSSAIVTMRDQKGRPLAAIPATADADSSYHTGLSLIDTIEIVKSFT